MASKKSSQVVHRPGPFKQSNKAHKGGRNKSKKNDKGKIGPKLLSKIKNRDLNKQDRRNRLNQLRKNKKEEVMTKKRGLGTFNTPPILVAVMSFGNEDAISNFLNEIKTCSDDINIKENKLGHIFVNSSRLKQRFAFMALKKNDLYSIMDAMKVVDVLLLMHSLEPPNESVENILSVIMAHSFPTTVHAVQGLEGLPPKKKAEYRKNILKTMELRFHDEKLHNVDTKQEFQLLLRQIGCQKQRQVAYRDCRPHLLAENVEYEASTDTIGYGTMKITGVVRGQPLDVNSLLHISGWGDYQMSQILYEKDPFPLIIKKNNNDKPDAMALDNVVLVEKANPSKQESLQSEVVPDAMEGEQTWPSQEELNAAELESKKVVKKVRKGTSDYQAAWIIDSEDEDDSKSESENESIYSMTEENELANDDTASNSSDLETAETSSHYSDAMDFDQNDVESAEKLKEESYDQNMDMEEEKKTLVRFKEERMNQMFPDEQDTPIDISARVRYQRYRGLKNFNSSPWDPLENLPLDYARIYRFESFKQTKKRVLNSEKEGAMPGMYITIHVMNVPQSLYNSVKDSASLVVYGLLKHEQKMSVMNVVIKKHPTYKFPIKSKDNLIFHIGYRRFMCKPLFSEHKTGNKFKFERFLPSDAAVVASFYAPVIFPPASVVVFKVQHDGSHALVATGSVLDMNPNRIIVKRIVLSGHPFKIFKKSAVVRYMFFNKDDINWFKCVELRTKRGRRGHIREPLGTHGHMKCIFDNQLQSQDVVLMNLYKRVFPKWTYDPYVPTPVNKEENHVDLWMK